MRPSTTRARSPGSAPGSAGPSAWRCCANGAGDDATVAGSALRLRSLAHFALPRQRIRPELDLVHLAGGSLPPFHVEGRAGADGGPEATPLPARLRVVDAAVQPLGVEPRRVGDAQDDPLPVLEGEEPLGLVAGVDRDRSEER